MATNRSMPTTVFNESTQVNQSSSIRSHGLDSVTTDPPSTTTIVLSSTAEPTMAPTLHSTFAIRPPSLIIDSLMDRNESSQSFLSTRPPTTEIFGLLPSSTTASSFVDFNDTSFFVNKPKFELSTAGTDDTDLISYNTLCYSSPEDYELVTSVLCSSLLVLGVVYFTFGYRCFRAVAFFAGLVFGTVLVYAVCTAENLIPFAYGNLAVSFAAGFFIALLTMLVTYIGLFVIGIHLGVLLCAALLIVIYLLRPYYEILQPPLSALTLLILFVAVSLVGAISTVYFSKGCTIIASSLYGSALTLLCADYFLENFQVIKWFLDNLSNGDDWYGLLANTPRGLFLCLGSQIMLALWPALTLFGIIVQSCITARGVEYRSGYGMVASAPASVVIGHCGLGDSPARSKSTLSSRSKDPEEAKLEQKHRKYRYLYQVRTAHGDVISQHYLQSLQNKKLCLTDQDSFTFNSDLSSHFLPCESRTTTLSVA